MLRSSVASVISGLQRWLSATSVVAGVAAAPALAQGPLPITVLHRDGASTQAHLAGLAGHALRIFDAERRLTTLEPGIAAVLTLHAAPDAAPALTGVLRLTDGQRLAGRWVGAADAGESLRWAHPTLGTVVVPLDRVAGWTSAAGPTPGLMLSPDPDGGDVVALSSGERLTGFLYLPDAAAGPDVIMLAPADHADGAAVPVPAASVAAVRLANPPVAPGTDASGDAMADLTGDPAPARVTLHDGSRLRAHALSLGAGAASFDAHVAGQALKVAVPAAAVRRVVFTAHGRDAHALTDLADLPAQNSPAAVAADALWGPGVAGATATPEGFRLAAPAQRIVSLPPGATFVVGRAVLDLPAGIAADRAAWAGCTLRIDGTPPVELALDAAQPDAPFRVSVPAGATELVFTLDPGPRGPVLDTVRIEDAVVLTAAP